MLLFVLPKALPWAEMIRPFRADVILLCFVFRFVCLNALYRFFGLKAQLILARGNAPGRCRRQAVALKGQLNFVEINIPE